MTYNTGLEVRNDGFKATQAGFVPVLKVHNRESRGEVQYDYFVLVPGTS